MKSEKGPPVEPSAGDNFSGSAGITCGVPAAGWYAERGDQGSTPAPTHAGSPFPCEPHSYAQTYLAFATTTVQPPTD